MKEYVERIIPSQCRIIDNKSGFIHIEGESAIFDMNGVYIGTAESTIGSIRENCIDAVIETLTNYKKKIIANQDKKSESTMSLYQHNIQNAEKKAVWLSVRYAFNQFKFNSNEQRTSSKTRN